MYTMAFSTAAGHLVGWINRQGISDLAIVPTNNCNPTQHVKILITTNICTTLPPYLAAALLGAEKCAQNLATFGVGTNIKSILLTFLLV
jgi:hypothetical protein